MAGTPDNLPATRPLVGPLATWLPMLRHLAGVPARDGPGWPVHAGWALQAVPHAVALCSAVRGTGGIHALPTRQRLGAAIIAGFLMPRHGDDDDLPIAGAAAALLLAGRLPAGG